MPLGVAKPPMQEPAVRTRCAMGFSDLARSSAGRKLRHMAWRVCQVTSSGQHLRLSDDGVDEIGVHDDGRWSARHEPSCRPATWRDRLIERIMPGHEGSPGLVVSRLEGPAAGTMQRRSR